MDEFWDVDTSTAPRVVDVYMAKLWDKLSACDDFEIVTVRGLPSMFTLGHFYFDGSVVERDHKKAAEKTGP